MDNNANNEEYISLNEASVKTGYSIDHLRRLIQKGKMAGRRIGRNYVTTYVAVQNYIALAPRPGPKPKNRA